jgi:hypothetical protein
VTLAILSLVVLLANGCDDGGGSGLSAPRSQESTEQRELAELRAQAAIRYIELAGRLRTSTTEATGFERRPCRNGDLETKLQGGDPELVLDFEDGRFEAKTLLPLALTTPLRTRPLGELEDRLALATPDDPTLVAAALTSKADAERALTLLGRVEQRRFKGVWRISDYAEPKLVRKLGKLKREWLPGVLAATFVIQHLESGRTICQTELLIARNDTTDAPIASRSRADTRERLIRELAAELYRRTDGALPQITRALSLPARIDQAASGPVAQRR